MGKATGGLVLLPAKTGTCPECATEHETWEPHNLCLYYQYHFMAEHGRFPTWKDAMEHCTDDVKKTTIKVLKEHGVKVG
jgi:hypothetical protein